MMTVRIRMAVAAVLPVLVLGCTRIDIHDGRTVNTRYFPGLAIVDVDADPMTGTSVDISGAGLIVGKSSVTLGWESEQTVYFPDPTKCQAVFIIESEGDLESAFERLRAAMPNNEGICAQPSFEGEVPK